MAAYRTLTEDNHAASQDVGAFHRDADGNMLIIASQVVAGPHANTLATVYIHRIVNRLASALGEMIFDDGRDDRGFLAQIHRARRHHPRRVHHVGIAADTCQRFFHAFKAPNGHFELHAHSAIRAAGARRQLRRAGAGGGQGNRSPRREAVHQHAPATTHSVAPADYPFRRDEHILPGIGAILKSRIEREMPAANIDTRYMGGDQRQRNTEVFFITKQPIRVMQPERKSQESRHRT